MANAVATNPSVMGPGFKETLYAINASNGAFLGIPCTIPCRRMEIWEVPAAGVAPNPPRAAIPASSVRQHWPR